MSALPCRIWAFRNDRGLEATEIALLDAEESAQAARLKAKVDRDAFIKTRAALRSILGRETGVPPKALTFRYNRWGKPSLDTPRQAAVDFSVSHTKGLSVVAVAQGVRQSASTSSRIVHVRTGSGSPPTCSALRWPSSCSRSTQAGRTRSFCGLWTAGEAFVKARGLGFAGMNGKVPVRLAEPGSERVVLRDDVKDDWSLTPLELGDEFAGHVAVGARAGERAHDGAIELRMAAGFGSR